MYARTRDAYSFARYLGQSNRIRRCLVCGEPLEIDQGDGIAIDPEDPDSDFVCDERCMERYQELI